MYLLTPALQTYDWGTTHVIAGLLGIDPTGGPIAEAWWGAHPGAPAMAATDNGPVSLGNVIAADAVGTLGADVAQRWANDLPFLLKVLSVNKPLSIQVHPSAEQAKAGYDRERHAPGATDRAFADRSAKPEMVVALTPMVLLAGFRPVVDLAKDLAFVKEGLAQELGATSVEAYLRAVLALPRNTPVLEAMVAAADASGASRELRAAADAARHHPGDPGALIALALNCMELAPGEALFVDAGLVHSYQTGTALEVMANSDNVVRAGLTSKPVKGELFLELADTSELAPLAVEPVVDGAARVFSTPAPEYELTLVAGGSRTVTGGPRLVLAIDGPARVTTRDHEQTLLAGQSVLVADREGEATVVASGLTAIASVPSGDGRSARS